MQEIFRQTFPLEEETLTAVLDKLGTLLIRRRQHRHDVQRLRLVLRGFFSECLAADGKGAASGICVSRRWGRILFEASCVGVPLPSDAGAAAVTRLNVIHSLNIAPVYLRVDGANVMRFALHVPRRLSPLATEALAFLAAVAVGAAVPHFLAPATVKGLTDTLHLVCGKFTNLLVAFSIPMIFFLVLNSIAQIGNAGEVRRKLVGLFLRASGLGLIAVVAALLLTIPFYGFRIGGTGSAGGTAVFVLKSFLAVLPDDLVSPFMKGDVVQVMVIGVLSGAALSLVQQRLGNPAAGAMKAIDAVFQRMLMWLCRLMPLYIFLYVTAFILGQDNWGALKPAVSALGLCLVGCVFCGACQLIALKMETGMSPWRFLKTVSQSLVLAFSTASSTAAYAQGTIDLVHKMGLPENDVGLGFPMGMVCSKASDIFGRVVAVIFIAWQAGMPLGVSAWPAVAIVAYTTALSVPPVAGGGIAVLPVLLSQFGLPTSSLPLLIILCILTDNAITVANFLGAETIVYAQTAKRK
jgi:Na+/H+-dicarboxylate symporter